MNPTEPPIEALEDPSDLTSVMPQRVTAPLDAGELDFLREDPGIDVTGFDQTEAFLRERGLRTASPGTGSLSSSQYDLLGELGKGAMGLVHLAKDRDLQRKVAYKQLLSPENRAALARFLREAQITAQLDHPHIVPIYGMEIQDDGTLAYSMKLVQGKTFKELINEAKAAYDRGDQPDGELALPQLLDYFLKACDAIAYAHSKGVIHRDLKPANIMVGRYGEVYVMDWGIARVMHRDEMPPEWVELAEAGDDASGDDRTRAGQILGTPRYMSPQQAAGRNDELDGRSDEFALGLILYELLMLKPAFTASNQIELLKRVLKAEKEPWTPYHPSRKVSAELHAIVDKATAQKPAGRYPDVSALAADLRRCMRGEAPSARPDNTWRKLVRAVGRHRELSLLLLAGVIALAGTGIIVNLIRHQAEIEQVRAREERLLGFVGKVANQGQRMDLYFQKMESLLQGLSQASSFALAYGRPSDDPWYINDPYALPPRKLFAAPDLIPSPHYTGEISPTWPIFILAPGVKRESVAPQLRQIASLRETLRNVVMKSYQESPPVPAEEWAKLLANHGAPLMWSYICVKQGIEFFYPGHDEANKDYDPRKRPYYSQSYNKREIVWGKPYDDPVGGVLIPCTQGLFDHKNQFIGTVGIDIRIDEVDKLFLRVPAAPAFKDAFLLNAAGEIVMRSGDAARPARRLSINEENVLKPYPRANIVAAIRQGRSNGQFPDPASNRLMVLHRLSTLGWYYVVEADYDMVLEGAPHD